VGLLTGRRAVRSVAHSSLFRLLAVIALIAFACCGPAVAQAPKSAEALELQVKAAYLYKFTTYVEWPADAFASSTSPIVIGVVGSDAEARSIGEQVAGRSSQGRSFVVRRVAPDDPMDGVHILFLGNVGRAEARSLLQAAKGKPLLTVSASRQAQGQGSMITLVTLSGRLRFEVALGPVAESRLKLSALMLTAAHRVVGSAR
jgi:YfiR/HmsC-like